MPGWYASVNDIEKVYAQCLFIYAAYIKLVICYIDCSGYIICFCGSCFGI
jgi:hypothetical protein